MNPYTTLSVSLTYATERLIIGLVTRVASRLIFGSSPLDWTSRLSSKPCWDVPSELNFDYASKITMIVQTFGNLATINKVVTLNRHCSCVNETMII